MSDVTDEELESRWKQGSTPAFAVLFERWHARVYAFARQLTGDTHLAEDLAQRAFLNIYKKPPPGQGRQSFKALLFTVARNEALNELKRRGRRREGGMPVEAVGATDSPAAAAHEHEERERVRRALALVPEQEREIVLLREVEGLSFREVCEVTGLTRDAVRWRLAKGLEALQQALGRGTARGVPEVVGVPDGDEERAQS
jgi:RNA polymerase sigma-70 factor (ECF subfamily)